MKYTATLKVMAQICTGTGETAIDAIKNLNPKNAKGKGILTVERDGKKRERVLPPAITARLFNTVGMNKEAALKNIAIMFDGI